MTDGVSALARLIKEPLADQLVWGLFDTLPEAVAFWDPQSRLLGWNRAAQQLYGRSGRNSAGIHVSRLISKDEWRRCTPMYRRLRTRGFPRYEYEHWRVRNDGTRFWTNVILKGLSAGGRHFGYLSIYRDMTKRREAEEALRRSEHRFRLLAGACFEGIFVHRKGRIELCNPAMAQIMGETGADLTGRNFYGMVAPEHRRLLRRRRRGVVALSLVRKDGTRFPAICRMRQIELRGSPVELVALSDLTDADNAEEARAIAVRLHEAVEGERRRVSRELHDGVAQLLTTAASAVGNLRDELPSGSYRPAQIQRAHRALAQALSEVRRISRNLHPSVLDDFGLVAALRALGEDFCSRCPIQLRLSLPRSARPLPPVIQSALYRIAQEGLTNVERHSRARHARLSLSVTARSAELELHDDGIGLDKSRTPRGLGLRAMSERASLLGGRIELESSRGAGTRLRAAFPVSASRQR